MLAQPLQQNKPTFLDPIELYTRGDWCLVYPLALRWHEAQQLALLWKRHDYIARVREDIGGWMVYVLAGVK